MKMFTLKSQGGNNNKKKLVNTSMHLVVNTVNNMYDGIINYLKTIHTDYCEMFDDQKI
jgi:hypothetical protein